MIWDISSDKYVTKIIKVQPSYSIYMLTKNCFLHEKQILVPIPKFLKLPKLGLENFENH